MDEGRLARVKPHEGGAGRGFTAAGFFMKNLACLASVTKSPRLPATHTHTTHTAR
jgi:hypothetical protein